jgi:hypothetical protein
MQVLIACAVGILICVVVMIVVIPIGMRIAGRFRKARTDPAPPKESTTGPDAVKHR